MTAAEEVDPDSSRGLGRAVEEDTSNERIELQTEIVLLEFVALIVSKMSFLGLERARVLSVTERGTWNALVVVSGGDSYIVFSSTKFQPLKRMKLAILDFCLAFFYTSADTRKLGECPAYLLEH